MSVKIQVCNYMNPLAQWFWERLVEIIPWVIGTLPTGNMTMRQKPKSELHVLDLDGDVITVATDRYIGRAPGTYISGFNRF